MPFFTVVIPTYNRAEKLRNAINSVLQQSFSDFELLVMDDGSTDHSEMVVKDFSDGRIRYDWAPNSGGPARPRNRGISAASAPWISFLDADDIWYPTRLSEVADAISRHSDADVFCHNEMLNIIGANEKLLLQHGPYEPNFYRIMLTEGNRLSTSAVTIRTEIMAKHQLRFNECRDYVIVEDYDLWLRLANAGAKFVFISKALGEYVVEKDNISLASVKARHNHRILLKDHVYKIQDFEPNKDKLWREIRLRLDLEDARELWGKGERFKGLSLLLGSVLTQPLYALRIVASKIQHKAKRRTTSTLAPMSQC